MSLNFKTLFRKKNLESIRSEYLLDSSQEGTGEGTKLRKELGVFDLTALGIAAVIGSGIFSTIGNAAFDGGPAVVFLFIFTAIACAFSALCYAEFAARIPLAGSAYTYAYASMGELIAWIIGWDLLMEYSIGNIALAISWSDYLMGLLSGYGITWPSYLGMDYLSASRGAEKILPLLQSGHSMAELKSLPELSGALSAYTAWITAPTIAGVKIICNLLALFIITIVTVLVYIGIKESKRFSNAMVFVKVGTILLVVILGAFYVHPQNWHPFAPNGISGVFKGVSSVFFAYIGFDSISTTAEECKNPQRDLPRGMIASLTICTILYVLTALVLTGMTSYKTLQVGDPLAFVFGPQGANLPWISGIIAISALVAMTAVLLVFQIGQPRIWMAMGRDGLLPPIFCAISPRFQTPWFSTILTGLVVAIPSLFMNLTEVTDLTSIGTLFAFVIVSVGILFMPPERGNGNGSGPAANDGRFRVPYINSAYLVPLLLLLIVASKYYLDPIGTCSFLDFSRTPFIPKIPYLVFIIFAFIVAILSFIKKLSLFPVLGLLCCTYLMTELGTTNWLRFGIWLLTGLAIYFLYSRKHSKLNSYHASSK